jgi:hypothetical protein
MYVNFSFRSVLTNVFFLDKPATRSRIVRQHVCNGMNQSMSI